MAKNRFFKWIYKFRKWLIGTTATAILSIIGFYSGGKELLSDIGILPSNNIITQEIVVEECTQDKNIRGEFLNLDNIDLSKPLTFLFGNNDYNFPTEHFKNNYECVPLYWVAGCAFNLKIDQNRLLLDLIIFNENNEFVAHIKNNQFLLNTDCVFTYNIDKNGFEIVNNKYEVVFSMDRSDSSPNIISVRGLFIKENQGVLISDQQISFYKTNKKQLNGKTGIKKMFEYLSDDYIGKRVR